MLDRLQRRKIWYGDGTFKLAPKLFCQIYSLHVEEFNNVIPCVYSLLPDKSS